MTDHADLIARLRNFTVPTDYGPGHPACHLLAADAIEALAHEVYQWEWLAKTALNLLGARLPTSTPVDDRERPIQ